MADANNLNSIDSLRAVLVERTITSTDLVRDLYARADRLEPLLEVYVSRCDGAAGEAATRTDQSLDDGRAAGPLSGVPIGIKDIFATSDAPTTAGSAVLPTVPSGDASAVRRLRDAGAIVLGKTTTLEYALGLPDALPAKATRPRNPWDPRRWTGGSSCGSASGVAAGYFPAALGSDTAGSIRIPAALCGVTGLKPTHGRIPVDGVVPLAPSLDHVGPIAMTARDCALLFGVLLGRRTDLAMDEFVVEANASRPLAGVHIGVVTEGHFPSGSDGRLTSCFDEAVRALEAAGAETSEVVLPFYSEAISAINVIIDAELLDVHRKTLAPRWSEYGHHARVIIASGAFVSGAEYLAACRARQAVTDAVAALFENVDVIMSPTLSVAAPPYVNGTIELGGFYPHMHTPYWDLTGNPALAVPIGFNAEGLPLSAQFAARWNDEVAVFRVGEAYQRHSDWHIRRPALPVDEAPAAPLDPAPAELPTRKPVAASPEVAALLAHSGLKPSSTELAALTRLYRRQRASAGAVDAILTG